MDTKTGIFICKSFYIHFYKEIDPRKTKTDKFDVHTTTSTIMSDVKSKYYSDTYCHNEELK